MKVTKREQMLIGALLLVLLGYCFYQFIYIKQIQQIIDLKASRETYSQKWSQARVKITSKDSKIEQAKVLNTNILSKTDMLFPSIKQEEIIVILNKMIKDSKIQSDVLAFSEVSSDNTTTVDSSKTANNVASTTSDTNKLDELVSNFNGTPIKNSTSGTMNTSNSSTSTSTNTNTNTGTTTNASSTSPATVNPKLTGTYKMEVTLDFKGTYDELIKFIQQAESYNKKIVINNINLTGALGSNVTGTLILDFYGVPKLNNSDDFKWNYKAPSGNKNPYVGSSSSIPVITPTVTNNVANTATNSTSLLTNNASMATNNTSTATKSVNTVAKAEVKSDFILNAKPKTTNNLHTITIEKAKEESMKSYIYSNNTGIDLVEFYFTKIESKYYYKYKISMRSYPKNFNNYIEFVPNGGNIVLNMVSQIRGTSSDLSGANIRITNETDKSVVVNILGDDKSKPRVSILKEKGDISVVRK
ncbi:hypothetical protein [Clostridium psychrophilum]|uniref:hypothetical protein n=1 Tax=Clostridium psychrophilum TaxID=132926 RepID=UPI001C0C3730|nr:hypothetical protein [Clostridium psychrophilum]MBU3182043.1 hypothetical protein [Clostridium psychrophilum]